MAWQLRVTTEDPFVNDDHRRPFRPGAACEAGWGLLLLRQQLKSTRAARTNADCAEVPSIAGQNPVDLPPLRNGGHGRIDQPQLERFELGVKLQSPGDIDWERQLVLLARRRIEDLGPQPAHRFPVRSEEVVHLRKNECGRAPGAGRRYRQ